MARGQQPAGGRPLRFDKLERHLGRRTRHAVDGEIALALEAAVFDRNLRDDLLLGVGIENMHLCHRLDGLNQPLVDGVGTDGGGNVATVHGLSDNGGHHVNLTEIIIDINAGTIALFYNRHLTGRGVRAAHTVDLTAVRRTKGAEDDLIALLRVLRQIFIAEKDRLARAAAHIDTGNLAVGFIVRHISYLFYIFRFSFAHFVL